MGKIQGNLLLSRHEATKKTWLKSCSEMETKCRMGDLSTEEEWCGHRGDSYRTAMQYASLPEAQLTLTTLFQNNCYSTFYRLENKLHKRSYTQPMSGMYFYACKFWKFATSIIFLLYRAAYYFKLSTNIYYSSNQYRIVFPFCGQEKKDREARQSQGDVEMKSLGASLWRQPASTVVLPWARGGPTMCSS